MDFRGVLILCIQLWTVFAKTNCPSQCSCVQATYGGIVAHCNQLTNDQVFSQDVQRLSVTNARVVYLESKFFQKVNLGSIQSVKITNSSLAEIYKDAFVGMYNLNSIDLSDNKLTYVHPDMFSSLESLQMVSFSGNPLQLTASSSKPNYFLKSNTITDIDLSRCQIRQITSETFSELQNIMNINLESNEIHFITPQMFEKLEYLEEINLSKNQITDIDPLLFADIEDMTTLKLSNNSLSKFDADMSVLKELDLSYNMFKTLESTTLEGTQEVAIINFSHNMIEKIDEDTFTDLNRLRYLDLSHNRLKGPLSQFVFETNKELETLSIAHNPNLLVFDGFSGDFSSLYRLDISYCGLTKLSEDTFENLQHISTLDLSGNELTELDARTFVRLTRLNNLDLSENKLTSLPEELFHGNMDLRKLSVRGNRIHNLPAKLFQPVLHLSSLDVSNCHLDFLWNKTESAYMEENKILSQLTYLNLENNKFSTLHKANFESMKNLKTLDISKNPFQCDEQFILFIEWLMEQKATAPEYIGKSSADLEQEHPEQNWSDLLSKVCYKTLNIIPINKKQDLMQNKEKKPTTNQKIVTNEKTDSDSYEKELNSIDYKSKFDQVKFTKQESVKQFETYAKNIPDIDYTSTFGLVPEPVIKTGAPSDSDYPWVWPLFLVLICGASILLALFNLAALLLYRSGRNYKVAGYRSTFIAPLSGHLKTRRDAGSFYHKLYEECSVPNTVPIIKPSEDFSKSTKKHTIVINGATKGEDMV